MKTVTRLINVTFKHFLKVHSKCTNSWYLNGSSQNELYHKDRRKIIMLY